MGSNTLFPADFDTVTENHKVFWCFKGVEKGCVRKKWIYLIYFLAERNVFLRIWIVEGDLLRKFIENDIYLNKTPNVYPNAWTLFLLNLTKIFTWNDLSRPCKSWLGSSVKNSIHLKQRSRFAAWKC